MTSMKVVVLALVIMAVMAFKKSNADLCGMGQDALMECKPAVTAPDPAEPSGKCCEALHHANLPCFCDFKGSPFLYSFGIDPDLATQLPAKCQVPNAPTC